MTAVLAAHAPANGTAILGATVLFAGVTSMLVAVDRLRIAHRALAGIDNSGPTGT